MVQERLAVLSMNIFCRPEGIHSGQWFHTGDYKDLRIALLLRKMAKFDVVILQEMFEAGVRHQRFVRKAYAMGFRYHCGSVWPKLLDLRLIDGGLLILSRYPIVQRDQLAFSQGSGSDGMCAKGVLYARIQLSPHLSHSLHVFTTHTQAGDNLKDYNIRLAQLEEMHKFIGQTIHENLGGPILITGDFNLDARHDLIHDFKTGSVTSIRCRESKVYQQLIENLERVVKQARQKSAVEACSDTLVIDLMKRCDTTKLGDELHPITNGDGHSSLVHLSDPLSLDKDGKCIDYMFFIPGDAQTDQKHLDSTPFQFTLEEMGTTVDHCTVKDLFDSKNDDDQVTQRLHQLDVHPVTHLSDHYGLRANFLLELTNLKCPDGLPVGKNEPIASVLQLYFPQSAYAQQPQRLWKLKLAFALFLILASTSIVIFLFVCSILRFIT
ncbi:Endonuclease/exonuclease/phosphatase [Plasmopara halstedii]|uniref:sphingomyelin phosphodiesterase n=1 Tax=Plasmopara halstedii TaxID=4781 RepID=A0A0P1AAA5_PLAHL|nr:Endonuclease/exonuclease/phosphatase [Plasmopara halstedii]CEG37288.1 Endonuclease/exonuclease/phosphatase [Plasmopara halstedii]|eukprot:XP_024573657.1 Endonuclease/exonuclease/phosphatase [Plasmopara halstedii]